MIMKKLKEEIAQLEESKKLFISIRNSIAKNKSFEKLKEFEESRKLEDKISALTDEINASLDSKKAILVRFQKRTDLYKKLLRTTSLVGLIAIVIFNFLNYLDLSVLFTLLLILMLILLTLVKEYVIRVKSLLIFSALFLLVLLAYFLFPPFKQVIENNSGGITLISLIYAVILTVFVREA